MKKIFWGLILFPLQTFAFFSNTEIEREMMRFEVEVSGAKTSFSISESIANPTNISQKTRIFWPSTEFNDVHFFVDAAGENFEILGGDEKNSVAFETAKSSKNPAFFQFGDTEKMFRSTELEIAPNSKIDVKIKFNAKTQEDGNFKHVEIFATDNVPSKNFELSFRLNSEEKIEHFFSTLPENVFLEKGNNSVVLFGNFPNLAPRESFEIFWSEAKSPLLEFQTRDAKYFGHLITTPPQKDFEEILILIDRSGSMNDVWSRVREITEFLTDFFDGKKLKIGFFNDTLKIFDGEKFWISENDAKEKTEIDFIENSFDFRKKFFGKWNSISAVGKTGSENLLSNIKNFLENKGDSKRAVFLISDMSDLEVLKDISVPLFVFDFSKEPNESISILSENSGGFSQKIFRTASEFLEKDDFLEKWKNNRETVIANFETLNDEIDITPSEIKKFSLKNSPLFVGRRFENWQITKSSFQKILPRIWAKYRIANLLKTQNIGNENIDAILSIGRTFGVKTKLFDQNTTREELKKNLDEQTFATAIEINRLENPQKFIPDSNAKFIDSIPFYYDETKDLYRAENFEKFANENSTIRISPFSDAQKNLFLQFPSFLSEGFSIGANVDFCAAFRCFSIREGSRENPEIEDRSFLRDFDSNYWANPFLEKLIFSGVMQAEKNGKLRPNAPIDRGEFLNILGNYFFAKEIAEFKNPKESQFIDVEQGSEFFNSLEFFANRNVVKGFPDKTFRPKQNLTRAEAVKILTVAFDFSQNEIEKSAISVFSDTVGWEKPFVNFAAQNGIIGGFADGLFHPKRSLSRAEAAKMIVLGQKLRKH